MPVVCGPLVYVARGKGLGGSTCTNATLYGRGSAEDYDSWGLEGWTSKDVLPWFIKTEDQTDSTLKPSVHGKGGVMNVENPRYDSPLHAAFFAVASKEGIHHNPDFNDWNRPREGYGDLVCHCEACGAGGGQWHAGGHRRGVCCGQQGRGRQLHWLKQQHADKSWTNEIFTPNHSLKPYALLQWAFFGSHRAHGRHQLQSRGLHQHPGQGSA